jgi:hypothetical protein
MTAAGVGAPERAHIEQRTLRRDPWWRYPTVIGVILGVVLLYLIYAVVIGRNYYANPYLSPVYSPCIVANCAGTPHYAGGWLPSIAPASPAFLIIAFIGGFRATCYYYRKAYYRSFWLAPAACAVPEPHKRYTGETRLPLIINNLHRYFWYITWIIAGFLTYDVVIAFRGPAYPGDQVDHWGYLGLGTLILLVNVIFIWGYQLSCHSCRHIMGGRLKNFSKHPLLYRWWTFVSKINNRHMQWALASWFSVSIADLYIRLLSAGFFADPHIMV